MTSKPRPGRREHFRHHATISTRWMDNDVYGYVNYRRYYRLFDTAVNRYLIAAGALDIHAGEVIGLGVEGVGRSRQPPAGGAAGRVTAGAGAFAHRTLGNRGTGGTEGT